LFLPLRADTLSRFETNQGVMSMPGLLEGKKGLILNIANDRSIAWAIADNAIKQGATCGFGYLPLEKMERRVRKSLDEMGVSDPWLQPCDVGSDQSIESFFKAAGEKFGSIDFLVHSLAFANKDYLAIGKFLSTPRDVFKQALDISAYSLVALARSAAPLMSSGGSILAMTYLGSEKAVPGYNVMGVAKAALESSMRYLAFELGEKKIRVNTISAGPVRTLSAMAVGGIDEMFAHTERKAPLKRNIEADEVGKTAVYLLSDLSSGVTGENIFVDSGFNIVGL
jgi:enoyl-[acyl-carrier protein] reductase I